MSEVRDEIMNLLVNLEKQGDIKTLYPSNVIPALVGYIAQREARAATAARRSELEELRKWFEELIAPPNGINPEHYITNQIKTRITWIDAKLAALGTKPGEQDHCLLCGTSGHTREQCQAEVTVSPKPVEREDAK